MERTRSDVLVVGAGIGGLTAALCLHRAGFAVRVLERVRDVAPLGVGINVQPPAIGVLTAVGLGDRLAERGVAIAENVYLDHRGTRLYGEPRGVRAGHLWPQYSVHRGELQTALLALVRARCGPDAVRSGTRVTGIEQDGGTVRVAVQDRTTDTRDVLEAGIAVGADGLHSGVRAVLHPQDGPLLHSGTVMWRGVTAAPEFLDGRTMLLSRGPDDDQFIAYPIHHPDRGTRPVVNWVYMAPLHAPGPIDPAAVGWNRPGRAEDLLPRVRDWDLGVVDVEGLIRGADAILEFPMVDKEPLPWWSDGRITLLGDAAHPMYPVGANGASQAVLDAQSLTGSLCTADDVTSGLAGYERERLPVTSRVVTANRAMHVADHRDPGTIREVTDGYRRSVAGGAAGRPDGGGDRVPQLRQTVLDTTDARRLAEFYRQLLDYRYRPGDEPPERGRPDPAGSDWLVLRTPDSRSALAFQQVAALPEPTWPDGEHPQMLHLNMTVPDAAELDHQHERAIGLGARLLLDRSDDPQEPLRVYADPSGHPFCVFVAEPG